MYKIYITVNTFNDLTIHFDPLYLPVSVPALFLPIYYLIYYLFLNELGVEVLKKIKLFSYILVLILLITALAFPGKTAVSALSLKPPVDISAEVHKNYIQLRWETETNNHKYIIIEKSVDQGGFSRIATLSRTSASYRDYSVSNGHVYTYRLRTISGSTNSSYSPEIKAVSLYPIDLIITDSYYDHIDLEWEYPSLPTAQMSDYETIIERRIRGKSSWKPLATIPSSETSYRDTAVEPDSIYYYRIRTRYSSESYSNNVPSDWGVSARTGYPLTTPLTGYAISETSIRLEWDMSMADDGRAVLQKKDWDGEFFTLYTSGSRDYYVDSWLTEGESCTYRLMIESDNGTESEFTDEVTITVESVPAPYRLTASALSPDGIILSWTYPYDSETGFEIWRKASDSWQLLADLPKNSEQYKDSSVESGETYVYKVRAKRGESAFSSFSQADSVETLYPSGPAKLVYYTSGGRLYIYSAKDVPKGTSYTLEVRKGLNSPWQELKSCTSGTLRSVVTYTDTTEYHFRLRANIGSLASYSPILYFYGSAPDSAQDLKASVVGADQIVLSWKDNGMKEEGYLVYRTVGDTKTLVGKTDADAQTITDKSPVTGAAARYEVLAYNAVGQSQPAVVTITILASPAFKDIANYTWAHRAIERLWALGALDYQNGYFGPQSNVTRGQMAHLILKSFGIPYNTEGLFTIADLPLKHNCYQDLMTAVNLGLMHPDSQNKIYPDKIISRGELLHMINNTLSFLGIPLNSYSAESLQKFTDYYNITAVDAPLAASFVGDGIITGKAGGFLGLADRASKAESVVIIYRSLLIYR